MRIIATVIRINQPCLPLAVPQLNVGTNAKALGETNLRGPLRELPVPEIHLRKDLFLLFGHLDESRCLEAQDLDDCQQRQCDAAEQERHAHELKRCQPCVNCLD